MAATLSNWHAQQVAVHVNWLGGHLCDVQADIFWDIRSLKEAVEHACGIPKQQQRLCAGIEVLCDDALITECLPDSGPLELMLVRRSEETVKWLAMVKFNPTEFLHAPADICADREVVLATVERRGALLRYVTQELRGDREIALAAVNSNGEALEFVSRELQADRKVALAAIHQSGHALRHAAPLIRSNREVVLAAVQQRPGTLQYAAEALRRDRGLVMAAVRTDSRAFRFASDALRSDRDVVLAVVKLNKNALKYASPELQRDPQVLSAAFNIAVDSDSD